MSKVVREDIDKLNAVLTVKIDRQDYEPRFENELKNYKGKAQMKGFRKGRVSTNFLKKAYGQSILADIINGIMQQEIVSYLREEGDSFLGQPIPSEEQTPYDFDPRNLQDYEFKFDIGIAPDFEIKGITEDNVFDLLTVDIPDQTIEEELDMARRRHGKREETEEPIQDTDVITVEAKELEDGKPKEGGWESEFQILVDRVEDEAVKKKLLGSKKGDTFQFDVFKLEQNDNHEYAKRYFLQMNEEQMAEVEVNPEFEGTIKEVMRVYPAELDEEFFNANFGEGEVSNEEEARAKIRKDIEAYYERQAEGLLFRDLQEDILEKNREQLSLPDEFLKRWLVYSSEENTPELVEKDYSNFAQSLRWSLIRNKLAKDHEIKVTEEEIRNSFLERVRSYLGGYMGDPAMLEGTVDRLMEDPKQVESVAEDLTTDKVFEKIRELVGIKEKKVSVEEFGEMVEQAKAEAEKARAGKQAEAATEEE